MERIVVDASVIVKWFVDEIYSEQALKIRDAFIDNNVLIYSPTLMPYEVLNALKYTKLFEEELHRIAKAIELYGFELISLEGSYAEKVVKLSVRKSITMYDASYVALGDYLNAKVYTADSKLIKALGKEYGNKVYHVSSF